MQLSRGNSSFQKVVAVVLSMLAIGFSATACAPAKSFDNELERVVSPYSFNLAGWEFNTLTKEIKGAFSREPAELGKGAGTVKEYFNLFDRINGHESEIATVKAGTKVGDLTILEDELQLLQAQRSALEKQTQTILEKQIGNILSELGIYNPTDIYFALKVTFPPVNFELADPPYLLVISPRDKIETRKTVMLRTSLSLKERERLEAEAEKLGVSALAVKLGGVATYPSFVNNRGDLRWVINTAVHEWLHQYLTFRPLGFRYFMGLQGISKDNDITAIDETVADIAGEEIGRLVYDRYYRTPGDFVPDRSDETVPDKEEGGFDFNKEMRETRKTVDVMLAQGKISEAGAFMEERRQFLATQGYYLRKLNQAYFAFYGSYTDSPTSIDPLGDQMRELRKNSASIKDFLDRASFITSREDLQQNLRQIAGQEGITRIGKTFHSVIAPFGVGVLPDGFADNAFGVMH